MAKSDNAVNLARTNPDLTEIAKSGPWVVFEVADSEMVTPLENEPAVVTGITDSQVDWVEQPLDESGRFGGPAIRWYTDPTQWDVPLASSGPDEWQRVSVGERPEARPVPQVEVSNIETGDNRISFDVDQVGSPVLVKASYFPNWEASGAKGPYRVAPNLMVVVPTDTHVELTYGRTWVEWFSYSFALIGLAGLVLLIRRPVMQFSGARAGSGTVEAEPGDWDEDWDEDDFAEDGFDDEYDEDLGSDGAHPNGVEREEAALADDGAGDADGTEGEDGVEVEGRAGGDGGEGEDGADTEDGAVEDGVVGDAGAEGESGGGEDIAEDVEPPEAEPEAERGPAQTSGDAGGSPAAERTDSDP
jgi:hypothetical protein